MKKFGLAPLILCFVAAGAIGLSLIDQHSALIGAAKITAVIGLLALGVMLAFKKPNPDS